MKLRNQPTWWWKRLRHHKWRRATKRALARGEDPPPDSNEVFDSWHDTDARWYAPDNPQFYRK